MSENVMEYFGTPLDYACHGFHYCNGEYLSSSRVRFSDFCREAFNPESLVENDAYKPNGNVYFFHKNGYSICNIVGGCYDKRPGTKTVFFIKEQLTNKELWDKINAIPVCKKICSPLN